ncbi:hypothetical protein TEA_004550 [Camellia sinensis var. sinensis]|uniref:Uncharacterized protein n=1 Tax=Camellia sinensis var. sinensis TaxID=542762 RepID=A0A4S4DHI6_CAMSN|nr:hypothetical protein TEA_004550 [Camellia sinensis var. sinensis]
MRKASKMNTVGVFLGRVFGGRRSVACWLCPEEVGAAVQIVVHMGDRCTQMFLPQSLFGDGWEGASMVLDGFMVGNGWVIQDEDLGQHWVTDDAVNAATDWVGRNESDPGHLGREWSLVVHPLAISIAAIHGEASSEQPQGKVECQVDLNRMEAPSANTVSKWVLSRISESRTDRIVFKLFGKDPSDFPLVLRKQILDWLSHSPTEIESYIRPGCIILTIYLRLGKSTWEELYCDLNSSLTRLLDASNDSFWRTGWMYTRVQQRVAFIYDGQVVLDTLLPLKSHKNSRILSIKPVAVSFSERTQFLVKGFNLSQSTTRLLCALEGKYLVQESCSDMMEGVDTFVDGNEIQCLSFSCSIPNVSGRGFIEVEDHSFSNSFFPFIVTEQDVCSEICTLESAIEVAEIADDIHAESEMVEARNNALDFIHEMGWLLHRSQLKFRLGSMDPNLDLFPFERFRWLMEFSMEHDWCAVVKKLLGIVFNGTVDAGGHSSIELALLDMGLLHRAVRRNCRSMVEVLLRYIPTDVVDKPVSEQQQHVNRGSNFLFRPDAIGPGGLTPLHIAASSDGSESVLDALTDDPGSVLPPCLAYIMIVCLRHEKMAYGSCRTSVAIYRPAMLSLLAIAAVCVCAALLFKSPPKVVCVLQPFIWERLKYGAI